MNESGTMSLSGKVIIKDNIRTTKGQPTNLATNSAINITGALTGSEIYLCRVDMAAGSYGSGELECKALSVTVTKADGSAAEYGKDYKSDTKDEKRIERIKKQIVENVTQ